MQITLNQLLGNPMPAQILLSLFLGTVVPFLMAWVARHVKSTAWKSVLVPVLSLAIGFVVCLCLGLLDWKNIVLSLLLIWYASELAYQKFWKKSTITNSIESKALSEILPAALQQIVASKEPDKQGPVTTGESAVDAVLNFVPDPILPVEPPQ